MNEFKLPLKFNWELAHKEISANESQFKYEIGEWVPSEGGVIYHRFLTGTTQNYLVVDTQDLGQSVWSNVLDSLAGAISTWDGLTNSNLIINQFGHTDSAAKLCLDSVKGNYTDWYLPSIDELRLLFDIRFQINKTLNEIAGSDLVNINDNYWSSTEYTGVAPGEKSWLIATREIFYAGKGGSVLVRAVRKFSI